MIGKLRVLGGRGKVSVNAEMNGKTELYKLTDADGWVGVVEQQTVLKEVTPAPVVKRVKGVPTTIAKDPKKVEVGWYKISPPGKPEGWVKARHVEFRAEI